MVKRILDLRDFPGDPHQDKVVHDYKIIEEDEDIQVVVECMGGLEPAYTFVKTALLQGRSVATSNKEAGGQIRCGAYRHCGGKKA